MPDELNGSKTLAQCMPHEFMDGSYNDTPAYKLRDEKVVRVHHPGADGELFWPGKHKNVVKWVELANGKAVGWNENPAIGWSFPVITYPKS